jgi:hypothetical protein
MTDEGELDDAQLEALQLNDPVERAKFAGHLGTVVPTHRFGMTRPTEQPRLTDCRCSASAAAITLVLAARRNQYVTVTVLVGGVRPQSCCPPASSVAYR